MCKLNNGECIVIMNGYYAEVGICMAIGLIWFIIFKKPIKNLQHRNLSSWLVKFNRTDLQNSDEQYY